MYTHRKTHILLNYRLVWYYGQFGIKGEKRDSALKGKKKKNTLKVDNNDLCMFPPYFMEFWKVEGVNADVYVLY